MFSILSDYRCRRRLLHCHYSVTLRSSNLVEIGALHPRCFRNTLNIRFVICEPLLKIPQNRKTGLCIV